MTETDPFCSTILPSRAATAASVRPRKRGRKKLDGRTWQAKLTRSTRAALIAHVGGRPSAPQAVLIDAAVQLTISIAVMDAKRVETGALTLHDGREYLAWQNTLRRALATLGMKAVAASPRTLADIHADRAARAAAA